MTVKQGPGHTLGAVGAVARVSCPALPHGKLWGPSHTFWQVLGMCSVLSPVPTARMAGRGRLCPP